MEVSGAPQTDANADGVPDAQEADVLDRLYDQNTGAVVPAAPPPSPEREDAAPPEEAPAAPQQPEISWATLTPELRNKLLAEADAEELRKHERISGLAGQMAQAQTRRRVAELRYEDLPDGVRERLLEESRQKAEQTAKEEQLARLGEQGEFYTLGEQAWKDLQTRAQERVANAARAQVANDFYQKSQGEIQEWAKANFPIEVLDAVRDEVGPELAAAPDFPTQYNLWLKALFAKHGEHVASQRVTAERQRWEREDAPAREQRAVAQRAASERTPDTGTGSPRSDRELTDEMIAAMDLTEFQAVWDMERDRPKEGYLYRPTRSVNTAQMKAMGGSR